MNKSLTNIKLKTMSEEERLQKEKFLYECIGKINKFIERRTVRISDQELTNLTAIFEQMANICDMYDCLTLLPVNVICRP